MAEGSGESAAGEPSAARGREGSASPAAFIGLGLGVFLLGLAVRAIRHPLVVTPDGVDFPLPGDLFYHMRRIWYSAVRFPEVLGFDPYVSFPDGAEIVWTGVFDLAIAGLARALGAESQAEVEAIAIWVPPVLGALTAMAVAVLAARLYGMAAGGWAGGLFAVLPVSFVFSQLGQLDHHVAVALAGTLLLAATMALVSGPASSFGRAALFGAAMAGAIGLWPGALVHVLVVQASALVWVLFAESAPEARVRAFALALAHGLAALLLAPFALGQPWSEYGSWSPFVLSSFQPVWFAAGAGTLALAGLAFAGTPLGRAPAGRVALLAGLGALGVAAALVALPALREATLEASGWFSQAEAFQEHVSELRPLLTPRGELDLRPVTSEFTLLALLFPFAALALLASCLRRGLRAADGVLLLFTGCFLLLALNQRRFANTLSVAYALVWGAVLGDVAPSLWRGWRGRTALRAAGALTAAVVVLAGFGSAVNYYLPYLHQARLVRRGVDPPRHGFREQQRLFERAGRFLRTASPATRGYLDPGEPPEYGVLANWGAGHLLRYRAERPMVQDNFGVYGGRRTFQRAWDYYAATDEAEAVAVLDALGVRYVVADPLGAGSQHAYPRTAMARRLAQHFGSERILAEEEIGALAHHRLLFHTTVGEAGTLVTPNRDPAVSVWERVAGARVRGTAPPGAQVTATLPLATRGGRKHLYRTSAIAGADGVFALTLPYPTDRRFSSEVETDGAYVISADGARASLAVPEAAIRAGATLPGPAL